MTAPPAIVIANGSHSIKAGFAIEEAPSLVLPAAVAPGLVGFPAQDHPSAIHPIHNGAIQNFDQAALLWKQVYSDLGASPGDHPAVLSDYGLARPGAAAQREQMAAVFFEDLGAPLLHMCGDAVLSLYGVGRSGGVCVDSGHGATRAVHVFQGHPMDYTMAVLEDGGGRAVERELARLLGANPVFGSGQQPPEDVLRDIKERLCRVSLDFQQESRAFGPAREQTYELPDGKTIKLGRELFQAPEAMLSPRASNQQQGAGPPSTLAETVVRAISKTDSDIRGGMYRQIIVVGGNSMFPGFAARLQKDIAALVPGMAGHVNVIATPERKFASWLGGALMGRLPELDMVSLSRQEYEESGPSIVRRKFIA